MNTAMILVLASMPTGFGVTVSLVLLILGICGLFTEGHRAFGVGMVVLVATLLLEMAGAHETVLTALTVVWFGAFLVAALAQGVSMPTPTRPSQNEVELAHGRSRRVARPRRSRSTPFG